MVVVGYVRVSTGGQVEDGVSIDAQRKKIEAWARLHDEDEVVLFEDAGLSGKAMSQRPGLQAALREVSKRQGVLVVHSLSRLARSTRDTLTISDSLTAAKAELVSLSERIDTTSASGKMVFRMLAVLAEFERDQVSERTCMAMAHLKAAGKRHSRFPPFGWDLGTDDRTLVANNGEQRVVRSILDMRQGAASFREIASRLDALGIPTKRGAPCWSSKAVWSIVQRANAEMTSRPQADVG